MTTKDDAQKPTKDDAKTKDKELSQEELDRVTGGKGVAAIQWEDTVRNPAPAGPPAKPGA